MADGNPQPNYDVRQVCIADMRARFREAVADPLRTALQKHSGLQAAAALMQIPIEAASDGFTVTIDAGSVESRALTLDEIARWSQLTRHCEPMCSSARRRASTSKPSRGRNCWIAG